MEKKIVSQRTIYFIDYLDILSRRTGDCENYYTRWDTGGGIEQ